MGFSHSSVPQSDAALDRIAAGLFDRLGGDPERYEPDEAKMARMRMRHEVFGPSDMLSSRPSVTWTRNWNEGYEPGNYSNHTSLFYETAIAKTAWQSKDNCYRK